MGTKIPEVKIPKPESLPNRRPLPAVPDDLAAALGKNPKAAVAFDGMPPSHKREYIEWIVEARREETRNRRIAQAIEMMSEGKPRNWKYMKR